MSPIFFPTLFASVYKFTGNILIFFWPIYLISIGLSGLQIGILTGAYALTGLLSILPTGLGNDRIKSKYLICFGLILYCLYLAISSFTNNFLILLPCFILGGLGSNLFIISVESLFFRLSKNIDTLQKVRSYNSTFLLFSGLGVIFGSQLLSVISFPVLLRLIASFLILLIITSFFIPGTETFKFELTRYKKDFFKKEILIFLSIFFLLALHYGAENTTYALFVKNNLRLNSEQTGLFIGSSIILMFFWTRLAIKKIQSGASLKTILYFGLLMSGIGHIAMTYPNLPSSFIFRTLHEGGDAFLFVILYYGITKIFPLERIGGLSSSITFTNTVATTIGALIFSSLGEKFGYQWPLIISGGTTLSALFIAYFYQKNKLIKN